MKGYRRINVQGKLYQWKVGRGSVSVISEEGSKMHTSISKLMGLTEYEVEKGKWKRWLSITPADIKDYILKETTDD